MGNYKSGGYEKKYIIQKADGSKVDEEADYFVLRLDTDPHALIALEAYANSVKSINEPLAKDLMAKIAYYQF